MLPMSTPISHLAYDSGRQTQLAATCITKQKRIRRQYPRPLLPPIRSAIPVLNATTVRSRYVDITTIYR